MNDETAKELTKQLKRLADQNDEMLQMKRVKYVKWVGNNPLS